MGFSSYSLLHRKKNKLGWTQYLSIRQISWRCSTMYRFPLGTSGWLSSTVVCVELEEALKIRQPSLQGYSVVSSVGTPTIQPAQMQNLQWWNLHHNTKEACIILGLLCSLEIPPHWTEYNLSVTVAWFCPLQLNLSWPSLWLPFRC